jgi:hypothetical protein
MQKARTRKQAALAVLMGLALTAGANAHAETTGSSAPIVPTTVTTVLAVVASVTGGSGSSGCNPLAPVTGVVNKVIEVLATPPANPVMPIIPLSTLSDAVGDVTKALGTVGGGTGWVAGGPTGSVKQALQGTGAGKTGGIGNDDVLPALAAAAGGGGTSAGGATHGAGPIGPVTSLVSSLAGALSK